MAKQRWGTFSVEDHQFLRQLIPDILCFDKLVFPYPADDAQRGYWVHKGWDPQALDALLKELGEGLVKTFDWGSDEREEFSERFAKSHDPRKLQTPWEFAKGLTADTVAAAMQREAGDSCWLMPRYGSLAAIEADRSIDLRPRDRKKRRTRLSVLVGHELALPAGANPRAAFELAVDLAKDAKFQRARRELYLKQEMTVLQEQSAQNDAQEFEDLVATFNAQITGRTKDIERGWMFTILKTAQDLGEAIEKPFSTALGTALEIAETATDDHEIKPGPVAFFHHVKKRVFEPASR